MLNRTLSVAPMMGRTDRHFRYLLRLLSPNALLYSEMVTVDAMIHGDPDRYLRHAGDLPCALQLGGSDPASLAHCASLAEKAGYSEVNLNLGCPSDRVHSGRMGACLMLEPELVRDGLTAMREAVQVPVTAKCRTGVDHCDSYDEFRRFVDIITGSGCDVMIVHARKAILRKLSPRENRTVPQLQYDYVYRLKSERPDLQVVLNGGLVEEPSVCDALQHVDGVMVGREAYRDPLFIARLDHAVNGSEAGAPEIETIARAYLAYMEMQMQAGEPAGHMVRHLQGLFLGLPGARNYRRAIAGFSMHGGESLEPVRNAVEAILARETPCDTGCD